MKKIIAIILLALTIISCVPKPETQYVPGSQVTDTTYPERTDQTYPNDTDQKLTK